MRARRLLSLGIAASLLGCAAVTGLGDFEVVPDAIDATVEAAADADATPPIVIEDATADVAAPPDAADARADTGPIDAGACGPCPHGTARKLCLQNACVATRRVFVTRAGSSANLGGLAGADAKCQAAVQAANLGGTWMAWLSTPDATPQTRFASTTDGYRLLDGTVVATSTSELLSNGPGHIVTIEHAINLDENATLIDATQEQEVWTGTDERGLKKSACSSFSTDSLGLAGTVGRLDSMSSTWTDSADEPCSRTTPHLYCFEQ